MVLDSLESTIKDFGTDMNTMIVNTKELSTFDDFDWLDSTSKRPPREIAFSDDPVALAVASHRLWIEGGPRWCELDKMKPTDQDRTTAQQLRGYYRQRMVMEKLKQTTGVETSSFRKKLGQLVTDQLCITSDEVGMLMRLPYFYAEDQAVDQVMSNTESAQLHLRGQPYTGEFTLVQRVLRSRRSGEYYDYWLTDGASPTAHRFVMKTDNPLRQFMETYMDQKFQARVLIYTQPMRGFWRGRNVYQVAFVGVA